jgi:hypothetical protein
MGCQKVNASHGFLTATDKRCALLSYYAVHSGNFLLTFQDKLYKMKADHILVHVYIGKMWMVTGSWQARDACQKHRSSVREGESCSSVLL